MTKKVIMIFMLSAFSTGVMSQAPIKPDRKFEIYLLLGQSNMAGRGVLSPEYSAISNPRVLVLNAEGKWSVAKHPLHYDKPKVAGVGPGLAFGLEMASANPKVQIGLVPCAVGGTSIDVWKPGAYDRVTKTHPFDDAEQRIREAMKYGIIKGMIWHQGEANSSPQHIEGYLSKLSELIERVRKIVGDKNLPVVAGQLGRFKESYQPFNRLLDDAPGLIPNLMIATSESLVDKGDLTHFDAGSATSFGKRFADKMLLLQKRQQRKK